jgi:hypothetical protein
MATKNYDIYVNLAQSSCDKLVNSVTYPFKVLEKSQPFPGCAQVSDGMEGYHRYSDKEIDALFRSTFELLESKRTLPDNNIYNEVIAFAGSIIEQSKKVLDVTGSQEYDGPSKDALKSIVDGGLGDLPKNLRPLGDFGIYEWCSYLRVIVRTKPAIKLNSPRIDLDQIKVRVTATGETWIKYPWFNCYQWCLRWVKVEKCDKIASVTPTLDVAADTHVNLTSAGSIVNAKLIFDKLRLDYPILRDIPLEGLANDIIGGKVVQIFDGSTLVTTVPVLKTHFTIGSLELPNTSGGIGVGITLKEV